MDQEKWTIALDIGKRVGDQFVKDLFAAIELNAGAHTSDEEENLCRIALAGMVCTAVQAIFAGSVETATGAPLSQLQAGLLIGGLSLDKPFTTQQITESARLASKVTNILVDTLSSVREARGKG